MGYFSWAILAAVIWGIVPVLEKFGLTKALPITGLFYRSLGVIAGLLIITGFMVKPAEIRSLDPKSAAYLILGGFLASCVAQLCFYNSLKTGEISRVIPIAGSYPLISFTLGILLFHESLTLSKAMGVALIIAGIWILKAF